MSCTKVYPTKPLAVLSPVELDVLFNRMIVSIAAEEYHFNASSWHPADGIAGLMTALRKEGPLAASSYLGIHHYEKAAVTAGRKNR